MTIETSVELTRSSWLAARVVDNPDLRNRILPRELSVFAHTSPIYFLKDGAPVREQASIAYLTKYVQGAINWLDKRPEFTRKEDLTNVRRGAEEALRIYQSL